MIRTAIRDKLPRHFLLASLFTACLASTTAWAPASDPTARHAVWRARNQIVVDGEPTPLFWAAGLSDPADLEAYSEIGFNTVEIAISQGTDDAWRAAEALARAAAERRMYVLIAITPPASAFGDLSPSPWDAGYRTAVRDYLQPVVQRGADLPGLVGWVLESVDADSLRFGEEDFWNYLMRWHGSIQGLIRDWGVPISRAKPLTESYVAGLNSGKPLGLGQASIDLARYRNEVYRDLLNLWAQEIRSADRRHVVLAGRQRSYRAAISVPDSCDGMLLGLYPGVAEDDLETHNAHGIDIARRGNQYAALPVLKVAAAPSATQVASWVAQAVLHGAAGVGFATWPEIRDSHSLRGNLRAALMVTRETKLCPRAPAASVAVLYEPFAAGGFASGRPLYGWLPGASVSEPGNLFRALARGTAFGAVDYLSESSLDTVPLERYALIIAPLALSLKPADQAALAAYVAGGGTLLADLGAGFAQSGDLGRLPPALAELFGVSQASGTGVAPPNFMCMVAHPRFPSLQREMGTAGGGTPASFDPPIYFVLLSAGATPVLAQWDSAPAFAGIMARPVGKGWALYATTRLWQNWLPGNIAFDAFHRDLIGLNSPVALKLTRGFSGADDMSAFRDGSIMALSRSREPTEVLVRNPAGRVYRIWDGIQEIRSARASANSLLMFARGGLQVADPLPIEVSTDASRVLVQVVAYEEDGMSLVLYGPATRLAAQQRAALTVTAGGEATAHIRISRGAYPVWKGSRHEVRIRPLLEEQGAVRVVTADEDGVLSFDAPANAVVTIKRLPPGEKSPRAPKSETTP